MSKFTFALAFMTATLVQGKDRREEKGASAVEYAILVAAIIAVVAAAVAAIGTDLTDKFSRLFD
ncbi:MAG: Flp family type IVb pilin [Aeromicrobium sp.]|jgi:Flp pilus assembly pilin Flp|nr:Flp family type IVb pilin [Aeromicrobium sp.]